MNWLKNSIACVAAACVLAACNGKHDAAMSPTPTPPPARGTLLVTPPAKRATYSPADLLALATGSDIIAGLVQLAYTPKCTIDVYQIEYQTVDPAGALSPASGVLMVPSGSDAGCQGSLPIVEYAHGTTTNRSYNVANVSADNAEALLLAVVFASQGYITVAPNYLGYDSSTLGYHPYLIAEQQANDMIDALKAARSALPVASAAGTTDSGKLFLTGYSQGGYVAMATHRAMQNAGTVVTASAPMSGPYALSAFGDAIFQGQLNDSAVANLALIMNGYQHAYSNVYSATTDSFESKYAPTIENLLPNTASVSDLVTQGKLPDHAVFDPTPPDPQYAAYTPATQPTAFAQIFAEGFGADHLLTNAFRLAYLNDAAAAPDGGFPTLTNGLPPGSPTNGLRQDLKTNDLRTWTPTAPVLLCAGNSDPTVFYFNTALMQNYWTNVMPASDVTVLDIDSSASSGDPYAGLKAGFAAAKDLVRGGAITSGDDPDRAVLDAYHATLVAPFCLGAVKQYFDAH